MGIPADLAGLDEIKVIENGALSIGALAKLAAVARSAEVAKGWHLLREAVLEIGLVQLRNMATLAGNICRSVPSADSAVALLVLDASVVMRGVDGKREIPMSEFLSGARRTMLADSEMVTEVRVPPLPAGAGAAFLKLHVPKVNAAALLLGQNGKCREARIGLGGVAATPIRAPKAEVLELPSAVSVSNRGARLRRRKSSPVESSLPTLRRARPKRRSPTLGRSARTDIKRMSRAS